MEGGGFCCWCCVAADRSRSFPPRSGNQGREATSRGLSWASHWIPSRRFQYLDGLRDKVSVPDSEVGGMDAFTCGRCGCCKKEAPYRVDGRNVCQHCFAKDNPILYKCEVCGGCQLMVGDSGVQEGQCHQGCAVATRFTPCMYHQEEESFLDSLLHGLLTCGTLASSRATTTTSQ